MTLCLSRCSSPVPLSLWFARLQAEQRSEKRQANKGKKRICPETWAYVEQCLRKDFSPEQISGVLKRKGFALSHEWIYQYILADKKRDGTLHSHLRCQRKRKRRYGKPDKRGQIKGRISIDTRPPIVAECTLLGDWEADNASTLLLKDTSPSFLNHAKLIA